MLLRFHFVGLVASPEHATGFHVDPGLPIPGIKGEAVRGPW